MSALRIPSPPLRANGVVLRALRGQDVPAIALACQDPDIQHWTRVPAPYRESDARGWIAAMRARERSGEALEVGIADAASGRLIGSIGIVTLNWRHRVCEIGFWVTPESRGRGIATIALRLLSRWALGPLGMDRVELHVWEGNAAAARVGIKAGFQHEGTLRSHVVDRLDVSVRRDIHIYGLLRADVARERAPERRAELGGGKVEVDVTRRGWA